MPMNDIYVTYTTLKTIMVKYFCETLNLWARSRDNINVYNL
jgi:hypothetical protein